MAYGLDDFCVDCRTALQADGGDGGREKIRENLEKLLGNEDFVAEKTGEFPDTVYITVKRAVVRANQRRREARAPYPPSPAAEAAIRRAERPSDTSS